jgi:hypothetical protein
MEGAAGNEELHPVAADDVGADNNQFADPVAEQQHLDRVAEI